MKIAIVVNSFPKVSETFIFNKVIGLLDEGIEVTVITHTTVNETKFFKEKLLGRKIKIQSSLLTNVSIFSIMFYFFGNLFKVLSILNKTKHIKCSPKDKVKNILQILPFYKEKYEIIHFEYSGLGIQYLKILDYLPGKKIISCRGAAEQITPLIEPNRKIALSAILSKVDSIHAVSNDMRNTLLQYGLDQAKVFINYPSIDITYFSREKPYLKKAMQEELKIISIGRLHWKKGFNYALIAIKILIERGYKLNYKIIGSGPEFESLTFIINYFQMSDYVQLAGAYSSIEVKRELEDADIFILPSLSEGLSNAVLEAMSMEIPVISANVGGMDEVIIHGENGFLVESMNSKAMANQIECIILNPEQRIKIGKEARKTISEKFILEKQIEKFKKEYRNTLSKC